MIDKRNKNPMTNRETGLGQDDGAPDERAAQPRTATSSAKGTYAGEAHVAGERERAERDFTEDREISEDERLEMFKDSMSQSVLPDLPHIPGYHICWLTTSNPRDSIHHRLRLGYTLLRLEDDPSWEGVSVTAGGVSGCIGVNEMVAAKIPLRLYNRYFTEVHHNMPLAEEEKLQQAVERLSDEASSRGSMVEVGDGTAGVVQKARPPRVFTE